MNEIANIQDLIAASVGEKNHMLGKLLYFSLANILVDKDKLSELCARLGLPYTGAKRLSVSDAFRSATGDIRQRLIVHRDGARQIYEIYCRDNERTGMKLSRELVKETLNERTNHYEKLANIHYDKGNNTFGYENLSFDEDVDAGAICRQTEELFELYQQCANRRQIETICVNYLRSLEATKVSVNGHLYFVPRHQMEKVDVFEDFVTELGDINRNRTPLGVNSIYVIDDARQRDKMAEEFHLAVKKEIAEYQERVDYLVKSGCSSAAVMERWVVKISALEEKKRHYEAILQRELAGLDEEFDSLNLLSQELAVRARSIRFRNVA